MWNNLLLDLDIFFFPLTSLKDFLEQGGIMNKIKKINR